MPKILEVMYKQNPMQITSLVVNESVEGEPFYVKVQRIVQNKEPIEDGVPTIFTERQDGVLPQYDIRTDRFDMAVEAMDAVSRDIVAKKKNVAKPDGEAKSDEVKKGEDPKSGGKEGSEAIKD